MLDRASSFAEPDVIARLTTEFVPVAVDEWYHVRRQDAEGEFYRRIVFQRPGMTPGKTTQGLYVAEPDGALVHGWNNRDPGKLADLLRRHRPSADAAPREADGAPAVAPAVPASDPAFARVPPEGGLVVDVFARVLQADWPEPADRWAAIFRGATGRDHLWVTAAEHRELVAGRWPGSLGLRIARCHLIDNTRGEPPMWRHDEVQQLDWQAESAGDGAFRVRGRARAVAVAERAYDLALVGEWQVREGAVVAFDLVARGTGRGHGRYTSPSAPSGPFTLGVAFRLAGDGPDARVPPQGARDLRDYLGR